MKPSSYKAQAEKLAREWVKTSGRSSPFWTPHISILTTDLQFDLNAFRAVLFASASGALKDVAPFRAAWLDLCSKKILAASPVPPQIKGQQELPSP